MNFLIVKTSSIGDVIQTFPVLEYLKSRYPDAAIDWVIEKEYLSLVQSHPAIRRAIPFSSRTWRKALFPLSTWREMSAFTKLLRQEDYDVLFDLQGNTKSGLITGLAKSKEKVGLGRKSVSEFPNLFATRRHIDIDGSLQVQQRYLQVVQKFFADETSFIPQGAALRLTPEEESRLASLMVSDGPRMMVACGSRWSNKKLSEKTLENIPAHGDKPAHQHIDMIYLAKPLRGILLEGARWFTLEEVEKLKDEEEIFAETKTTIRHILKNLSQ